MGLYKRAEAAPFNREAIKKALLRSAFSQSFTLAMEPPHSPQHQIKGKQDYVKLSERTR